ncbi:MAG: 30S ribosomal protein S13 [Candidatus Pacearchaeota archaeon]
MNEEKKRTIVRIAEKDIRGDETIFKGLTEIKGISWMVSNAICRKLNIDRNKKAQDLSEEEIRRIEEFLSNNQMSIPSFLKNRKKDREEGTDKHLIGSSLDLQNEFDIKRMKKIKCYKGIRHTLGQPVRGQRTKSHFRKNKSKSKGGVKKKKKEESKE